MSTTAEKIAVMQAWLNGETIEFRLPIQNSWDTYDYAEDPAWVWDQYNYRIKPKPREWWVIVYPSRISGGINAAYTTREEAEAFAPSATQVHVREVIQ